MGFVLNWVNLGMHSTSVQGAGTKQRVPLLFKVTKPPSVSSVVPPDTPSFILQSWEAGLFASSRCQLSPALFTSFTLELGLRLQHFPLLFVLLS